MEVHETYVVSYLTGVETFKAGQSQAECKLCGKVGPACDFEADARAIADRHTEVGGFER